jgi:hypothetical protein
MALGDELGKISDGIEDFSDESQNISNIINDPIGALAEKHGVPSCLLDLGAKALSHFSSEILGVLSLTMLQGSDEAGNIIKNFTAKIAALGGWFEAPTELGFSMIKIDLPWGLGTFGDLADMFSELSDLGDNIQDAVDCVKGFVDSLEEQSKTNPLSPDTIKSMFSPGLLDSMDQYAELGRRLDASIRDISDILEARRLDPSLEPTFGGDPGVEDDIFRLTYGPPLTTKGQYILTSDGLYYDSQKGGLDPINLAISGVIAPGDVWKYDYDPNLGGRGDSISLNELSLYTDNIFDPDIIDDSVGLKKYYEGDTTLQMLVQQRDKQLSDLSGLLFEHQTSYGDTSPITKNHRESIITAAAKHNSVIDKRKKQIEVYVKVPMMYGDKGSIVNPGGVPINDFSLLEEYNVSVDLEKQKALTFQQADVDGIVLPINPIFVTPSEKSKSVSYNHMNIPNVGIESIVSESASSAPVLSLTDGISKDGLVAIYNFLETKNTTPSGLEFNVTNSFGSNKYNNAQLAAPNAQGVFTRGLGIPYLEGIAKNKSTNISSASGMGSFYKLPDTKEYRELTYGKEGFTVEFWAHIPDLTSSSSWTDGDLSSLTRCVLACENVGSASGVNALDNFGDLRDLDYLEADRGEQFVRGLVIGFTRDRRITQDLGFSNSNSDNNVNQARFFIAPTQSRDLSSASWINSSDCLQGTTYFGHSTALTSTSTGGKTFSDVNDEFVMCTVTVDPINNTTTLYADGELVSQSSVTASFGTSVKEPINLPTRHKANSFEYSESTTDAPTTLHGGPKLNNFYTPWIVGGGYTDGMANYNNFLGGNRGGNNSALNGHIGSMRFYSRPISSGEVLANYKTQQGFFKNIDLDDTLTLTANIRDQYYGPPNEQNTTAHLFDLYEAKTKLVGGNPTFVYLHPGGGTGGSRETLNKYRIKSMIDHDINVVTISYRLLNSTGELGDFDTFPVKYPWLIAGEGFGSTNDSSGALLPTPEAGTTKPPLTLSGGPETTNFLTSWHDGARIVQHLKYYASKYNIDPDKIILGGGSFGSVIANWITWAPDLSATPAQTNDPVLWESTKVYAGAFESTAFDLESYQQSEQFIGINSNGNGHAAGKTIYDMSGSVYVPTGSTIDNRVVVQTSSSEFATGFKSSGLDALEPGTKYTLGTLMKNRGGGFAGVPTTWETYDSSANFSDWSGLPGLRQHYEQQNMPWSTRVWWSGDRHSVSAGDLGDSTYGVDHLAFGKLENSGIPVFYNSQYTSTSSVNADAAADWKVILSDAALAVLSGTGIDVITTVPVSSTVGDAIGSGETLDTYLANPNLSALMSVSGFGWPSPNSGTYNEWDVSSINDKLKGSAGGRVLNPRINIDLSGVGPVMYQETSAVGNGGMWENKPFTSDVHDPMFGVSSVAKLKAKYSTGVHSTLTSSVHYAPDTYLVPGAVGLLEAKWATYPTNSLGGTDVTFANLIYNEYTSWMVKVLSQDIDHYVKYVDTIPVIVEGSDKVVR